MFMLFLSFLFFFFFNDTATTEIYTLSLHDALPISTPASWKRSWSAAMPGAPVWRSEEHTSELQSRPHLVCRLLLEKKKQTPKPLPQLREQTKIQQQWLKLRLE